mmetsp:Transcript_716/g.2113  ORF Transcript_716/g.2113 Transcript_716/m.2113 type:complete len:210 (+) Transcript_716:68-697(+)
MAPSAPATGGWSFAAPCQRSASPSTAPLCLSGCVRPPPTHRRSLETVTQRRRGWFRPRRRSGRCSRAVRCFPAATPSPTRPRWAAKARAARAHAALETARRIAQWPTFTCGSRRRRRSSLTWTARSRRQISLATSASNSACRSCTAASASSRAGSRRVGTPSSSSPRGRSPARPASPPPATFSFASHATRPPDSASRSARCSPRRTPRR